MKSALFIAYIFPPLGGAGVQRSQKFVRFLPDFGFMPVVITGPGKTNSRWTPSDSSLAVRPEIQVLRASGQPSSAGLTRQRLNRLFACPTPFGRWWVNRATELSLSLINRIDVIFATMSPFESALAASNVSKISGRPWIADLRDPWALDETVIYMSAFHRKLEVSRMLRCLSTAAAIIMNTPEAAHALRRLMPSKFARKIFSITNGFDSDDFQSPVPPRKDAKFRIVHTGTLLTDTGMHMKNSCWHRLLNGARARSDISTRSPIFLFDAIRVWQERCPEASEDLEIIFAGVASDQERELGKRLGIRGEIRFTGYIPHSESLALVRTADLLFLPMHTPPEGRRSLTIPAKTFEYMASGRPILAAVPEGDAKDFLTSCGTALICSPSDVEGMVEVLNRVYSDWKKHKHTLELDISYISRFERRTLTQELAHIMDKVLASSALAGPVVQKLGTSISH